MKGLLANRRQAELGRWTSTGLALTVAATAAVWVPQGALVASGVVFVFVLATLRSRTVAILVVISTFCTRLALPVYGGYSLHPEHVMMAVVVIHLALQANTRRIRTVEWRPVVPILAGLVGYIVWAAVITLLYAPSPGASSSILTWFAIDAVLLFGLTRLDVTLSILLRWGVIAAAANSFLAILVWGLASGGGPQLLVQADPAFAGFAAYNFTWEANILASLVACWAIIGLCLPRGVAPRWAVRSCAILAPVVSLVTHTRAAFLAYSVGLLVLSLSRRGLTRRSAQRILLGGGLLAVALLFTGLPGTSEVRDKFSQVTKANSTGTDIRAVGAKTAMADLHGAAYLHGLGTNSYGQRHLDPSRPHLSVPGYLGNLPLQLLYDTGVIGTMLLILPLAFARRGRSKWSGTIPLAVTYGVTSISTSYFWFAATWLFVAIGVSTGFVAADEGRDVR